VQQQVLANRRLTAQACELQLRADARDELPRREGLHEIVIGHSVQALYHRLLARASRKENSGHIAKLQVRAQGPQQREAVHPRHHDIRDDQVRRFTPRRLQSRLAVGNGFHFITALEQLAHIGTHIRVVIGHDHA
jgi:hypothetical protein